MNDASYSPASLPTKSTAALQYELGDNHTFETERCLGLSYGLGTAVPARLRVGMPILSFSVLYKIDD